MANDIKISIGAENKGLKKKVAESKSAVKGFGSVVSTALGFSIANIASRITGLFKDMIAGAVRMSAKFEDLRIIFNTMIGDIVRSQGTMQQLKDFSIKTPFTPEEVFRASKALIAFGFAAKEQIGLIKMLGDVSAATGKPLEEIAFIYGKIFSRGKAQARELNQLIMAGVPIVGELAKVMKKPQTEIANLSKQGKISFGDVEAAFKSMTQEGGVFFGLTEKRSQALSGRWSTLKGSVMDLGRSIGDGLAPALLGLMNIMIRVTDKLTEINEAWLGIARNFSDAMVDHILEGPGMGILVQGPEGVRNLEEFNRMLAKQAEMQDILRAKETRRQLEKQRHGRINEAIAQEQTKGGKANLDQLFQRGIFLVNPSDIGSLDINAQQLEVMRSMEQKLDGILNNVESADANINNRANVKAIREGVGV
jgi:tape measure domain-containing protein